jgi:hypothetical protein
MDYSRWDSLEVSDDEDETQQTLLSAPTRVTPQPAKKADAKELVHQLMEAERLGEDVLTERSQMVELDRRRNLNREALAALRREDRTLGKEVAAAQKHWICMGDMFMRQPHGSAREMLEADQARIEKETEALRASVKRKSSKLCEIDPSIAGGSDVHRSFVSLHGVSAADMEGLLSSPSL